MRLVQLTLPPREACDLEEPEEVRGAGAAIVFDDPFKAC
jgi:hypothetical protein